MKNILKDTWKILYNNSIFIQPLIIFVLIANALLTLSSNPNLGIYKMIVFFILYFLLLITFWAGWTYIHKMAVENYSENDDKEVVQKKSIEALSKFASGVGENFLKYLGGYVLYTIIALAIIIPIANYILSTSGMPAILEHLKNPAEITAEADLIKILSETIPKDIHWWQLGIISSLVIFYTFFLFTVILSVEKKNFIYCFGKMLVFLFKNIIGNIMIFLIMLLLYILGNLIILPFGGNIVASFFLIIYQIFYIQFCVILMLRYYNEKNKVNSDSRTECIGEDKTID